MYSWVSMEYCRHGIPHIFFLPYIQYAMLCYAIYFRPNCDGNSVYKNTRNSVEFHGTSRILRAGLDNMYEFEYLIEKERI
jgi:hypothetical protein